MKKRIYPLCLAAGIIFVLLFFLHMLDSYFRYHAINDALFYLGIYVYALYDLLPAAILWIMAALIKKTSL